MRTFGVLALAVPLLVAAPARADDPKPLAVGKHKKGVVVEVVEIKRADENLMQIIWRYRNPTDQVVEVYGPNRFGYDGVPGVFKTTAKALYYTYGEKGKAFRSRVAKGGGGKVECAQNPEGVKLKAGQTSGNLWAKFGLPPDGVKTINLVFDDVEEPIELTLPSLAK
jgi:hypothetical protein